MNDVNTVNYNLVCHDYQSSDLHAFIKKNFYLYDIRAKIYGRQMRLVAITAHMLRLELNMAIRRQSFTFSTCINIH